MEEHTFNPGDSSFYDVDSPNERYGAFFEDDGETGYFYAVDLQRTEDPIVDAVHIYNTADVVDRNWPSSLTIIWSEDGMRCALLINGSPHGAFDFEARARLLPDQLPQFS